MKNLLFLLSFLSLSFALIAQPNTWNFPYGGTGFSGSIFSSQPFSGTLEKSNSFLWVTGREFREISHYGRTIHEFKIPNNTNITGKQDYYFLDQINFLEKDYIFSAYRGGDLGGTYLNTISMDGELQISDFYLEDEVSDDILRGHAAIKNLDGDYLFFGQTKIYKVQVNNPGDISVVWEKDKTNAPVSKIKQDIDGYIVCGETGLLEKYNLEGDLMWSKNFNDPIYDMFFLDNGEFILGGLIGEKGGIKKVNEEGTIIWQVESEHNEAYALTPTSDGGYIFGGKKSNFSNYLTKVNELGVEQWSSNDTDAFGNVVDIIPSKYGGYFVHSLSGLASQLKYIDENGNFDKEISDENSSILDINNIRTTANARGRFFSDDDFDALYQIKNNELRSTIFTSGLWLAGIDENEELRVTAQTYLPEAFFPGAVDGDFEDEFWNHLFKVNKSELLTIRDDLTDGEQELPIPYDLLWWPAKGNPNIKVNNNEIIIEEDFAPFEDVNNDGIYNIYDGDYPIVKGDEMLWWKMNDWFFPGGDNVGVEVTCQLYGYSCGDELLENSTFLEMDILNISGRDYSDLYMGLFTDFDLGCYQDDSFGTIPSLNSYYAYNSDNFDEDCPAGIDGFGTDIPIQSITFLNNPMTNSMYYNSVAIGNPIPGTTDPAFLQEYYNYMQSRWRDGIPLTNGGSGYNLSSDDIVSHCFDGDPSNIDEWSMCSDDLGNGDRRMISSTGGFNFAQGETLSFDIGLLTHFDIQYPCPNIDGVKQNIQELQDRYDNYISNGIGQGVELELGVDYSIFPGEALDAGEGAVSYIWSTGETTQTIIPISSGTYSVTVTTVLGCILEDEIEVEFSLNNIEIENDVLKVKVYPNPTQSMINIATESVNENLNLKLYNTLGQLVLTQSISGISEREINIENLPTGIYLLQIQNGDLQKTVKLMKE